MQSGERFTIRYKNLIFDSACDILISDNISFFNIRFLKDKYSLSENPGEKWLRGEGVK
jgi:hypothetical protein